MMRQRLTAGMRTRTYLPHGCKCVRREVRTAAPCRSTPTHISFYTSLSVFYTMYATIFLPPVSIALKKFRENGFVTVDSAGQIDLTDAGLAIAKNIYEKHRIIAEVLMSLGVDEDTAYTDACRMEHCISDTSFAAIKNHLHTMQKKKAQTKE